MVCPLRAGSVPGVPVPLGERGIVTPTRTRSLRAAGALLLLGSLVATGCSGDGPAATSEPKIGRAHV